MQRRRDASRASDMIDEGMRFRRNERGRGAHAAPRPTAMPARPPSTPSNRHSTSSCRAMRNRVPPSAARTASSRVRPTPRARIRLAMLAHASSSTNSTTPPSTSDVVRRSAPTIAACIGSIVTLQPLLVAGFACSMFLAITVSSARACSSVVSGFMRPITRNTRVERAPPAPSTSDHFPDVGRTERLKGGRQNADDGHGTRR